MAFWLFCQDFFYYIAPEFFVKRMSDQCSRAKQLSYNNFATGVKAPWIICGAEVEWISVIGAESSTSISITTYNEVMKLSVCTDKGYEGSVTCE